MKNLISFFALSNRALALLLVLALLGNSSLQAQIINGSFESNSTGAPAGWSLGGQFGSGIDTNVARTGSNSLSVWNWYYYSPGIAVNGNLPLFSTEYHLAGTPVSGKPVSLDGYYLYDTTNTNTSVDSAIVWVLLKKFNVALHKVDTVGFGTKRLGPVSGAFEPFQVLIQDLMPGVMPDSVVIFFKSSGNGFCSNASTGDCLYLNVDDLAFDTPAALTEQQDDSQLFSVFPNPVNDLLTVQNFSSQSCQLRLMNAAGLVVWQKELAEAKTFLETQHLANGFYIISMKNHLGLVSNRKLLIQH